MGEQQTVPVAKQQEKGKIKVEVLLELGTNGLHATKTPSLSLTPPPTHMQQSLCMSYIFTKGDL